MTHAYKSLIAEKQALEITLKALKTKSSLVNEIKSQQASQNVTANTSRSGSVSDLSDTEFKKGNATAAVSAAKLCNQDQEEKIAALTSNIHIIMDNKAKMEANYLAEKKKLRVNRILI